MDKNLTPNPSDFLLYTTPQGDIKISALIQNETIWLSQRSMANLFECSSDNISLHLKNIFKSSELNEKQVAEDFSVTAEDGKTYRVKHYNLDAIISVGYRVHSSRATQFRIWATQTLRSYIIKGFAIDEERLKNGSHFGKDKKMKSLYTSLCPMYTNPPTLYLSHPKISLKKEICDISKR